MNVTHLIRLVLSTDSVKDCGPNEDPKEEDVVRGGQDACESTNTSGIHVREDCTVTHLVKYCRRKDKYRMRAVRMFAKNTI